MITERDFVNLVASALPESQLHTGLVGARFQVGRIEYARIFNGFRQRVRVLFDVAPSYSPGAIAHINPDVILESEALAAVVRDMISNDTKLEWLLSVSDLVVRQQLWNLAPPEHRHDGFRRASVHRSTAVRDCLDEIWTFAQRWALPFLDQYCDIASLTRGYERGDDRLGLDRRGYLYIIAAYIAQNNIESAAAAIERHFGRPGSRKEFASVFAYVENLRGG